MCPIYFISKPKHITSFQAVNKLKNKIKAKKAGHTGTLDPLAEGLLIICTDRETKKIREFNDLKKTYIAEIEFGKISDTYDYEGKIKEIKNYKIPTIIKIKRILKEKFTGNIRQITPAYSSAKIGGKTFHSLIRKGKKVPKCFRDITIYEIKLLKYSFPILKLKIICSSGTYIRSIAYELGENLKCGGILKNLKRTQIGDFKLKDAKDLKSF